MTLYKYVCQQCGQRFESKQSPGAKCPPKFCSHQCYGKSKQGKPFYDATGHIPWNRKPKVKLICEICHKPFEVWPYRKDSARYCSHACMSEAKRRVTGPDHPLWTCVEMPCKWCGKVVWVKPAKVEEFRFCSRRCHGSYRAAKMAEHKGPTDIEQLLMDELDRRHISYRIQHKIACWLIDITLPQHNIAIEADGDHWHSSPEQQRKDANKNHWLRAHKWTIFRFSGTQIHQSPADCIDRVIRHINQTR